MSQTYSIKLKDSVSVCIHVDDMVQQDIHLTSILPEGEMKELFRDKLKEAGWEEQEDNKLSKQGSQGETMIIDLENLELVAVMEESEEITEDVEIHGRGISKKNARNNAKRRMEQAKKQAEQSLDNQERTRQNNLTRKLEEGQEERMREVNEVLQGTYAEATKTKAARMGEVMEVSEGTNADGQYELVIRLEV
jgi:hypothetical protein